MNATRWWLAILVCCLGSVVGVAKDVGIFVNGGYGVGETDLNGIVAGRVDKAREVFDKRYPPPGGESHRADSRDDLENQLRALDCGAGDNITITLMGHGEKDRFVFSLEANRDKRVLTPAQLCSWIGAASKRPGCCVRIVIFACHSGSWIDDLSACPNVKAIYTSCRASERSYSDVFFPQNGVPEDGGDWLKGFNEDWEEAPAGLDPGDALDAATESAWEKMPVTQSGKQHPTGWRKGELPARAHVEQAFGTNSSTAKLHFWDPVFMRCKVQEVSIDRTRINVGRSYKACEWIEFKAGFDAAGADGVPTGPLPMTGPPALTERPSVNAVAHVVGVGSGKKFFRIHTIEPNWMYCKVRDLKLPAGTAVDPTLTRCNWIREDVAVIDPDGAVELVDGAVAPAEVTIPVLAHVEGTRPRNNQGQLCLKIQEPSFLANGESYYVIIPMNQLRAYRECDHVRLDLRLNTVADGVYRGDRIVKLDQQRFEQASYDLALDGLEGAESAVPWGMPVALAVQVRNAGRTAAGPTQVSVVIRDIESQVVFQETHPLDGLAVEAKVEAGLPAWLPPGPGRYRLSATVQSPGDQNPANDSLGMEFVVEPPATGAGGWQGLVIGGGTLPPVTVAEQTVGLVGMGQALNGPVDQLSFAFQQTFSDFEVACVFPPGGIQPGQTAGLMFRAGPDAPAPFAAVYRQANQLMFSVRPAPGAPLNVVAALPAPGTRVWIGLGRRENRASAQYSLDGWNWVPLSEFAFQQNLPRVSFVGLMASSPAAAPIRFDDVSGFPAGGTEMPRPRDFAAAASGPGSISLSWTSGARTQLGFLLERAGPGEAFQALAVIPPVERSYIDQDLVPATEYAYRIRNLGYYETEMWAAVATAETMGPGLPAWAAGQGVADPFRLQGGNLPVARYAVGDGPQWVIQQGEPPRIRFTRQPGTQDIGLDWQTSPDLVEWVTLRTAGPGDASGPYEFVEPILQDAAFFRLVYRPETPPR